MCLRHKVRSLIQLGRYDEAASVAGQAAQLAATTGAVHSQIETLKFMGYALSNLGRHETAESIYSKAAQLAESIGDEREQSRLLCLRSLELRQ